MGREAAAQALLEIAARALPNFVGAAPSASRDRAGFLGAFALATQTCGGDAWHPSPVDRALLVATGFDRPIAWTLDDLGRVTLLLLAAKELGSNDLVALVTDCFDHGDNRERQAVLQALDWLPNPSALLALATSACRTNVVPVFCAVACENAFPAAHFPDLYFNQLVLKALFLGVAVDRIVGLKGRLTPELVRMADDYGRERAAAGRSVPGDIGRLHELAQGGDA